MEQTILSYGKASQDKHGTIQSRGDKLMAFHCEPLLARAVVSHIQ